MATKTAKRASAQPASKVLLAPVLQYGNCSLAIPDQLSLGDDDKLYLTYSGQTNRPSAKPQTITLKELVAWFRVGHECSLKLIEAKSSTTRCGWLSRRWFNTKSPFPTCNPFRRDLK